MEDADLISRLPVEIIVSILSRLTLKEAIATSVLSRHWEKLWTFYNGSLDFDASKVPRSVRCYNLAMSVNKLLDKFELVDDGGVFDSFTIHFYFCPHILSYVDRCLQFVMEKRRVKRLEFKPSFKSVGCSHHRMGYAYDFPLLKCFYAQPRNMQTLTYIRFHRVNLSCEIIEHFLSNCPLLQSLELIQSSEPLVHLRVSGETLALRHLNISACPYLTTIEISAPNLVSFKYLSEGTTCVKFDVQNVPKLAELSIGPVVTCRKVKTSIIAVALHLLSCFSHIQKLVFICNEELGDFTELVELTSLKHLTLSFPMSSSEGVIAWTPLLNAFPALQKLTVDIKCRSDDGNNGVISYHDDKFPIKCLKEFEFFGFGRSNDVKLVKYFLKSIVRLEKIILGCDGGVSSLMYNKHNGCVKATALAKKLEQIIPKEVSLVFIGCSRGSNVHDNKQYFKLPSFY